MTESVTIEKLKLTSDMVYINKNNIKNLVIVINFMR